MKTIFLPVCPGENAACSWIDSWGQSPTCVHDTVLAVCQTTLVIMVSHVNVDVTFLWASSHLCHFCHGVLTCAICTCTILGLHDLMTVSSKTISL